MVQASSQDFIWSTCFCCGKFSKVAVLFMARQRVTITIGVGKSMDAIGITTYVLGGRFFVLRR